MVSITRQDLQSVIDNARNRLLERIATRQDVHALQDTIKALTNTLQQSQQMLRHAEYQRVQLVRRAVAMESRMVQLEHELQNMRRVMTQLADARPTEKVTERVIMTQPNGQRQTTGRYFYNPSPAK